MRQRGDCVPKSRGVARETVRRHIDAQHFSEILVEVLCAILWVIGRSAVPGTDVKISCLAGAKANPAGFVVIKASGLLDSSHQLPASVKFGCAALA